MSTDVHTHLNNYHEEPRYLLYGTDWPICNMKSYLRFMKERKLSAASMETIMSRNAAQLFKIDLPAA